MGGGARRPVTGPDRAAMGPEAAAPRRDRWALAGLLLLGGALRLAAVLTVGAVPQLHGDEVWYIRAARAFAAGHDYPSSQHAPGLSLLMAAVFQVAGGLTAARLAQIPVSLLSVALVYELVRRRFGSRAAFLSGALCAVHPTLIHYTHFLWSETLFAALLLLSFWLLVRFDESRREAWLLAAGAALGLAALTREMVIQFTPLLAVWLWRGGGGGAAGAVRRIAWVMVPLACVVLPWTARNYTVHGQFVLITTTRWAALAVGNELPQPWSVSDQTRERAALAALMAVKDEIRREQVARAMAIAAIAREQPWWIAKKLWRNTCLLFTPESQLSRFTRAGWLRPAMTDLGWTLFRVETAVYVAQMLLGITALWLVPGGRPKGLVVAWIAFSLLVYVVSTANHRYRVPLLPLFALYAGPLLTGQIIRDRRLALRVLGAAACILVFAAVLAQHRLSRPVPLAPASGAAPAAQSPK